MPTDPSVDSSRFDLTLPTPTAVERLLVFWGRDPRSLSERVDGSTVTWVVRGPAGPGWVRAEVDGEVLRCSFGGVDEAPARRVVRGGFGLHLEVSEFELRAAEILPGLVQHGGLRIPQTATVWDGFVWVVAGQQVSLPVAFLSRRKLTERFGAALGAWPGEEAGSRLRWLRRGPRRWRRRRSARCVRAA